MIAGACALVAGAALAAVTLTGSDDSPTKTTTTAARAGLIADAPMHGVTSPLSLTSTSGTVWVAGRASHLDLYDAGTHARVSTRPDVGAGAHAIASGHGSLWVLNADKNEVIRIDARTGRRAANSPGRLGVAGQALIITAGGGAVWVGVRNRNDDPHNEYVVRIDPDGGPRRQVLVAGGVQDLAAQGRSLWVTNRAAATVTRIDTSTLQVKNVIPVGAGPKGIAVGEGAVWVAASKRDALSRIDLGDLKVTSIGLKSTPDRVTVGGGAVWVTSRGAGRLLRVDPASRRVRETIATGYDPYALDVVGNDSVWIGLVRENAVQRVRFSK
jgi:YVTN family beta-propeller protein